MRDEGDVARREEEVEAFMGRAGSVRSCRGGIGGPGPRVEYESHRTPTACRALFWGDRGDDLRCICLFLAPCQVPGGADAELQRLSGRRLSTDGCRCDARRCRRSGRRLFQKAGCYGAPGQAREAPMARSRLARSFDPAGGKIRPQGAGRAPGRGGQPSVSPYSPLSLRSISTAGSFLCHGDLACPMATSVVGGSISLSLDWTPIRNPHRTRPHK